MSKRILLAGLCHETHTFLDGTTPLEECEITLGDDVLDKAGDASPLGGAIEAARAAGWALVPALDIRAASGPTMDDQVVARFWRNARMC